MVSNVQTRILGFIVLSSVATCMKAPSIRKTRRAVSVMSGPSDVKGVIVFKSLGYDLVRVTGTITGLRPGPHGFHVHEFGDLSNGCTSAGAHFNPFNRTHGGLHGRERHAGDLGNVVAGTNGVANVSVVARQISLSGPLSIIGRAIVVHADRDDLGLGREPDSSKTGHSGVRLACGVIGIAVPQT